MIEPKTDAALNILFELSEEEKQQILEERNQRLLVKYNGDIERVVKQEGGLVQKLNNQFAVVIIPLEKAQNLLQYTEIEYMEAPKNFAYNSNGMTASCITVVQNNAPYRLKGEGVLLGIIDSGINYAHPDFRNEDGTTRIVTLWDQSIKGNPPPGFLEGTQYTSEQINQALQAPTKAERLRIVPSEDTLGHGTHVAGIAGGNGRGSRGTVVGAAPEAEFVIVKLASAGVSNLVRTIDIMLGVKYVIEVAKALGKPIAVNLSLGMNEGSHDGKSLIELYLEDLAQVWKNNIMVGAGNEGIARNHVEGTVAEGGVETVQLQIGPNKAQYNLSVWQDFADQLSYEIIAPNGDRTPRIRFGGEMTRKFVLANTRVYTSFAGPSPLNGDIEFGVFLNGLNKQPVTPGLWQIKIYGDQVLTGTYNVWGETTAQAGSSTYLLGTTSQMTLTTPSTTSNVISVGAYDAITGQIAPFSGRGYTRPPVMVKPDLVAPGVDITAPSFTGGYQKLSGTSMATPHVTGAVALMMEWGIVQGNDPFLYGESIRTYLVRGAIRDEANGPFPNPSWGYGKLCLKKSLDLARQAVLP